jgi:hypothetical protein
VPAQRELSLLFEAVNRARASIPCKCFVRSFALLVNARSVRGAFLKVSNEWAPWRVSRRL